MTLVEVSFLASVAQAVKVHVDEGLCSRDGLSQVNHRDGNAGAVAEYVFNHLISQRAALFNKPAMFVLMSSFTNLF